MAERPFTYQCQQGPVAEAEAVGVTGSCRGYSPYLLLNANRCHWNASCTFIIEGKPLVKLADKSREPTNSSSPCIGRVPEQIEMSFTCVKKNAPVTDVLGQTVNTDKSEGIIRSHRLYPWTYRNGIQLGNVTFNRPRGRPTGLVNLWISVRSLGILLTDYLFLSWRDNPSSEPSVRVVADNDTTFSIDNVQSAVLTFYADYDQHHTEVEGETKGFILCFQWLKRNKTPKKGSTCTSVLQPAKCSSGGGGGNRGTAERTRQPRARAGSYRRNS